MTGLRVAVLAAVVSMLVVDVAQASPWATSYSARATVEDLGLRSDGQGEYADDNKTQVTFRDADTSRESNDRFMIHSEVSGKSPRTLRFVRPDNGTEISCDGGVHFQIGSTDQPYWFNTLTPGASAPGRASLHCYTGRGGFYSVAWRRFVSNDPPVETDCPAMISRDLLNAARYQFSTLPDCLARVRRFEGGLLKEQLDPGPVPFRVTAELI